MASGPAIGIDLGTTYSCAAIVQDGRPQVIRSKLGYTTIPSVVTFNKQGDAVVGVPAERRMVLEPKETIYGSKRLIGRTFLSGVKKRFQPHFQYELVSDDDGFVAAQMGDRTVQLVDVASMILDEIRKNAHTALGKPATRAVVTVPAYFNDNQRAFVREAGKRAGLDVLRILNEPTAAALAYGIDRGESKRLLVFDLGGGTFDVSILELDGNVFTVRGVDGDSFLGGIDFDRRLMDLLLERICDSTGRTVELSPVGRERLRREAQEAKHQLSVQQQVFIRIPSLILADGSMVDVAEKISRQELEEATAELVDLVMSVVRRSMDRLSLRAADIDEVLLVGGQTRMPMLHEKIRQFFGKEPSKRVHPDEVVAMGAAIAAHSHDRPDAVTLRDVVAIPIGITDPNGYFMPVVPRNAPIPDQFPVKVRIPPNYRSFKMAVFQGTRSHAFDNEYLGALTLDELQPSEHSLECDLLFKLDEECLLTVQATIAELGIDKDVTLATQQTPDEVLEEMGRERVQVSIPQTMRVARAAQYRSTMPTTTPTAKMPRHYTGTARKRQTTGFFSKVVKWFTGG